MSWLFFHNEILHLQTILLGTIDPGQETKSLPQDQDHQEAKQRERCGRQDDEIEQEKKKKTTGCILPGRERIARLGFPIAKLAF